MASKLDPMDLKQIISLHLDGLSNRKIAELLGIGRNTVNSYMQLFKSSGQSPLTAKSQQPKANSQQLTAKSQFPRWCACPHAFLH